MNQFGLNSFINKLINNPPSNFKSGVSPNASGGSEIKFVETQEALNHEMMEKTLTTQYNILKTFSPGVLSNMRMNNLESLERSLYFKDLMKLPKEIEEVLVLIQNSEVATAQAEQIISKNINLSSLAELIQTGGKEAMNKLVLVMAEASKQGITDVSQIKEAMKFINASVSIAAQNNPTQLLKTFMLLYLPWLPLQEGVDFDLEIETSGGNDEESETSVTILISTRNYGNVKVTLILVKGNSIDIYITCSEDFPKDELLKRIKIENKTHSIQSNVTFEQKIVKKNENSIPQAKIGMSNISEVNPFLLLMANAIIRHTIEIDNLCA